MCYLCGDMPISKKDKDRLSRSINKKIDILDSADDHFKEEIGKFEKSFFAAVLAILDKFTTKAGNILATDESNTDLLISLTRRLKKALDSSTFKSKVGEFLANFDKVEDLSIDILNVANGLSKSRLKRRLGTVKAQAIEGVAERLLTPAFQKANLTNPIRSILFKHVVRGSNITEAKEELRLWIKGDEKRRSQISRYVTQIASDAINQYDGKINQIAFDEYDMDGYYYVGSIIANTRPQCRRWVSNSNGVIKREDLQNEIDWAFRNGSGMNPATTPANFGELRGGYNCRHAAIPYIDDEALSNLDGL